jgi:ATP-dependent Lon protease
MNSSTYGHTDAKNKIMQIVCQWISNPKSMGNVIALQGPPGIGKTSLVRNGISKALNRPFHMIALGGATDSTILEGHGYTYEGSTWGRIANILMESKVMNPIIFFDELDKVSGTKHGEEIIGVLTHLTDQTQNSAFSDKYFAGIDLDLSRCLFVFSYNDESAINPILKDRLIRINLNGFSCEEKINIAKDYILKDLVDNIGMEPQDVVFPEDILRKIINEYTEEEGVRSLRRCLETILLKLNMAKYTVIGNELKNISFPITLNEGLVKTLLTDKSKLSDFSDVSRKMMYI